MQEIHAAICNSQTSAVNLPNAIPQYGGPLNKAKSALITKPAGLTQRTFVQAKNQKK